MIVTEPNLPEAGPCAICDICGDTIRNAQTSIAWSRPGIPTGPIAGANDRRLPNSIIYLSHLDPCFDTAAELMDYNVITTDVPSVLRIMAPALARRFPGKRRPLPDEIEIFPDPFHPPTGNFLRGPMLQPESRGTHCLQLRLLWEALRAHTRRTGQPDLDREELAIETWMTPHTLTSLLTNPQTPRRYPLQTIRLYRCLLDQADAAGLLPLKRGRLVIG